MSACKKFKLCCVDSGSVETKEMTSQKNTQTIAIEENTLNNEGESRRCTQAEDTFSVKVSFVRFMLLLCPRITDQLNGGATNPEKFTVWSTFSSCVQLESALSWSPRTSASSSLHSECSWKSSSSRIRNNLPSNV